MNREERIARRAYNIWCAEGWPKGRDKEHWEQARREIDREGGKVPDQAKLASEKADGQTKPNGKQSWKRKRGKLHLPPSS
jgi:hypothetical protein